MPRPSLPRALRAACVAASVLLAGCKAREQVDAKFGDQNFKTAVALIELYHVRHGVYPESLRDLDFAGDWDAIAIASVSYQRLPDGYALDVTRGWVGQPTLAYPDSFWTGLGLRRSNVARVPATRGETVRERQVDTGTP